MEPLDTLDYKAMSFWWSLLQGAATGLTVLWVWLTNRQKVNSEAIEKLREDVNDEVAGLDRRLIGVEKDLTKMPSHGDLAKVHDRINESNKTMMEMQGNLKQVSRTVSLIHEHLLNGGKR